MESSTHESVADNEGISSGSKVSDEVGSSGAGSRVETNGSSEVEDSSDKNELNVKGGGGVSEASPSFPVRKGLGLKKWKRIRRDVNRDGKSSVDNGGMVAQDSPRGGGQNPSKRVQYADRKQKSETSVSSTNAVLRSSDGFNMLDDGSLGLSPSFAAGTDSENSEDRSSRSSTAASAPRMKYEIPVSGGFPLDRTSDSSSVNGKNSMQFGLHGKGRVETSKKARGERVKIDKENSHSSVESDSRSSPFVFAQGAYSVSNSARNEGENRDEVHGSGEQVNHGHEGLEDLPPEDVAADSSWTEKEGRGESRGSVRDNDPLAESMLAIQSAQEALREEVLKFKEIGNDVSMDESLQELCNEYTDVEPEPQDTRGAGSQSSARVEIGNRELEELFKQKVEAEVEYLTISRTVQSLRAAAVGTVLEQQKALTSLQTKVHDKLRDKLGEAEEITSAGKILKLQKRACKYGSCFLLQLVLLLIMIFYILQISQDYVEAVPT